MPVAKREILGKTACTDENRLLLRFDLEWFQPFEFDDSCHKASLGDFPSLNSGRRLGSFPEPHAFQFGIMIEQRFLQ